MTEHVAHDALVAFVDGTLTEAEAAQLESHLAACPRCAAIAGELVGLAGDSAAPATVPERPDNREPLAPETDIDRYTLGERLGAGGMGVVYAAYDHALHRRVALKVVSWPDRRAQERLLAEARTMAQLSHRDIVQVFDAGTYNGRVYIAMELVPGTTLRAWQVGRSRDDIVAMYVRIGEALHAAHATGVIHRDFKPENVLVTDKVEPRITDFGLAKVDPSRTSSDPFGSLITKHTISGKVAGTPGYMSPEQLAGDPTDARTDQYAFACSLHEALVGVLPDARTAATPDLPPRLAAALARGYAEAAADRWPSMREIVDAIAPTRQRRRWPFAVAAVAVIVAAFLIVRRDHAPDETCDASAAVLAVWNDGARADARRSLGDRAAGFVAAVDDWTVRWANASMASCRATQRGEQSAQLQDLRAACFRRELDGAAHAIDLAKRADRELVKQIDTFTRGLPQLAECDDTRAMLGLAGESSELRFYLDDHLTARVDGAGHLSDNIIHEGPVEEWHEIGTFVDDNNFTSTDRSTIALHADGTLVDDLGAVLEVARRPTHLVGDVLTINDRLLTIDEHGVVRTGTQGSDDKNVMRVAGATTAIARHRALFAVAVFSWRWSHDMAEGPVDRTALTRAELASQPAATACYERRRAAVPGLRGAVEVLFRIDTRGHTEDLKLTKKLDPEVDDCVVKLVGAFALPAAKAPTDAVYRYTFRPPL